MFAASYLPVHTTKMDKVEGVYDRNLGTHLLKVMHIHVLPHVVYQCMVAAFMLHVCLLCECIV